MTAFLFLFYSGRCRCWCRRRCMTWFRCPGRHRHSLFIRPITAFCSILFCVFLFFVISESCFTVYRFQIRTVIIFYLRCLSLKIYFRSVILLHFCRSDSQYITDHIPGFAAGQSHDSRQHKRQQHCFFLHTHNPLCLLFILLL